MYSYVPGFATTTAADSPGLMTPVVHEPSRDSIVRAVFVSFNDGDNWQPLRLNMPATSIRDLVIHDADLVAGTHGRGFWILDDIAPLRQLTPEIAAAAAHLFVPGPTYRLPRNTNTDTPLPPEEPAVQRLRVTPAPLPAPATTLIGRKRERAEVAAAVAISRLVTLTGTGGTGKTRLALHVARDIAGDFDDGVAFIDLAPVRDPALLATTIARALGLAPASAKAAEAHLAEAVL